MGALGKKHSGSCLSSENCLPWIICMGGYLCHKTHFVCFLESFHHQWQILQSILSGQDTVLGTGVIKTKSQHQGASIVVGERISWGPKKYKWCYKHSGRPDLCLCGIQMCMGVTGQIGWVGSLQAYLYEYWTAAFEKSLHNRTKITRNHIILPVTKYKGIVLRVPSPKETSLGF